MDWITIVWSAMIGTSFAMGLVHLAIWLRRRQQVHILLISVAALAVCGVGFGELEIMHSESVAEISRWLRWIHWPILVEVVALVAFVQVFFGTGRLWLACVVVALRAVVLVVNQLADVSINYSAIVSVAKFELWGDRATVVAEALINPWSYFATFSIVIFVLYVTDASVRLWRTGDALARKRAVIVGGSIAAMLAVASGTAFLRHAGWIDWPYLITPSFVFVLIAIGYELATDVLRAADLARMLDVAEQRLRLAATAAGIGIWEWEARADRMWVSETGRRLLGFAPSAAVTPQEFFARLESDGESPVKETVEQARVGGGEFDAVARVPLAEARSRWVTLRGSARAAPGNGTVRGVVFDITEHREAEQRLRMVAEGSPNAVMMVDARGIIVYCNGRAESLFGYARAELLGHPVETLIPASLRADHEEYRNDFVGRGTAGTMRTGTEFSGLRKDGSEVPVEVWLTTVRMRDEVLVLVNIVDTSGRRRAELELAQQRSELAHLSRVAMMGELSGSLAHELNQPLTAILSNAQATQRMAEKGSLSEAMLNEILQDIVDDSKRAGEVIRRLRAFIRHGEIERERLNMNQVVQEVLRLLRSDLLARRVSVNTDLASGLPPVRGDRIQMQQVLINLIHNGCEAMEQTARPCTLTLRTARAADGGVRIAVIDQGTGIPTEQVNRVFEPFVTTKSFGMGLGLAVCRTIVQHHGGLIGAENNPEGGATFDFVIPPDPLVT